MTVTPRWFRISMFVFAAIWAGRGILALAHGEDATGWFSLALGLAWLLAWLLMAFFRDKLPWVRSGKFEAVLERQRARVHGQSAMSFLPDSDSRPQGK